MVGAAGSGPAPSGRPDGAGDHLPQLAAGQDVSVRTGLGEALSLSLTVTVTDAAALEAALALIAGLARLRGDAP